MKKPSKLKLTMNQGKTPPGESMGGSAPKAKSPLEMLGGKKDYKKPGSGTPAEMGTQPGGFGMTGLTGET